MHMQTNHLMAQETGVNDTNPTTYATEQARWQALIERDRRADGAFVYGVVTTGVYCRPGCSSRRPNRGNVRFFDTCEEAEGAGFRACKRCSPHLPGRQEPHRETILRACQLIEQAEEPPSLADLAGTVRASYYGEEVMRLQRGRHEVKLMVRYPQEERRSVATLSDIRVTSPDGVKRPLDELAEIDIERGYSEINRLSQRRSITVVADIDVAKSSLTSGQITGDMAKRLMPDLLAEYPRVNVRWEGEQEQTRESLQSLGVGFVVALFAMFVLLTMEFKSYFQPLLIIAIIPFGCAGSVFGHALMGMPLTIFSMFGLVALAGVVVNDSIVLIDFINHRVRDGVPLKEALVDAGQRRFRAVLLTSITTIAALAPLLFETSFQAQVLIPMVTSLCFGLALTTVLVLVVVPVMYLVYARVAMPETVESEVGPALEPRPEPADVEERVGALTP